MALVYGLFSKIGSLFSRFGKKKTTIELLEKLDKDIKEFEKFKQKNELNQRKYIGALVLWSIISYIIGAIVYYIYLMPTNLVDRLKTLIPFLITPLIVYCVRKFLKWFFIKRSNYIEKKLADLKEEKKTILEEVKEKETYKKAKEILERFSSGVDINITPPMTPMQNKSILNNNQTTLLNRTQVQSGSNGNLVHRNVNQANKNTPNFNSQMNYSMQVHNNTLNNTTIDSGRQKNSSALNATNIQSESFAQPQQQQRLSTQQQHPAPPSSLGIGSSQQQRTLLPRPIVAPNRTFFDKLLDFVIGEGPNNRYALICKSCHFHNGMALKEEFEYVAFRCAYCLFYNEARKTKLTVPKLNKTSNDVSNMRHMNDSLSSSLSSSNSLDDMDNSAEPISTSSTVPLATTINNTKADSIKQKSSVDLIKANEHKSKRKSSYNEALSANANVLNKQASRSVEKFDYNESSQFKLNGNNKENFQMNKREITSSNRQEEEEEDINQNKED